MSALRTRKAGSENHLGIICGEAWRVRRGLLCDITRRAAHQQRRDLEKEISSTSYDYTIGRESRGWFALRVCRLDIIPRPSTLPAPNLNCRRSKPFRAAFVGACGDKRIIRILSSMPAVARHTYAERPLPDAVISDSGVLRP